MFICKCLASTFEHLKKALNANEMFGNNAANLPDISQDLANTEFSDVFQMSDQPG